MNKRRNLPLIIFCYATIYLVWSSTYLFIALAVKTIPPAWIMAARFLMAGIIFTLIPVITGQIKRLPAKGEIFYSVFLGFFLLIMGNGMVTFGEQTVDSYITALILSTIPLVVAFYNRIFFKAKLAWYQFLGIIVGFGGVSLLLYTGEPHSKSQITGIIFIFVAILNWGFGTSFSKKMTPHSNIFFSTGIQMLFAGAISFILALILHGSPAKSWSGASPLSIISVFYLGIIGSLAIAAYNYLLKHEPTHRITSYTFVNPLLATVLGIIVNHETATPLLWAGIPLILGGLFLMLYVKPVKK